MIWNNGWVNAKANGNMFYSTKSLNSDKISHTAIFAAKNKAGDRVNVITMEDWKNGVTTAEDYSKYLNE